jgi:L,D-transpeptidase YcbB
MTANSLTEEFCHRDGMIGKKRLMERSQLIIVATGLLLIAGMIFGGALPAAECVDSYWHQITEPTWAKWQGFFSDPRPPARETAENTAGADLPAQQAVAGSVWEQAIREALSREFLSDADRDLLLEAYQTRDWKPLFITPAFELTPDAHRLLQRFGELENDAIDPQPYKLDRLQKSTKQLMERRRETDPTMQVALQGVLHSLPARLADAERVRLCQDIDIARLLRTAMAIPDSEIKANAARIITAMENRYRGLCLEAGRVDTFLAIDLMRFARDMQTFPRERLLSTLTGQSPVGELSRAVEPSTPQYAAMRRALASYRELAGKGEQKKIAATDSLRVGEHGPAIRRLQERLREEGFYGGELRGVFDAGTVEAVKQFQRQHQLEPDGALGAKTIAWLNVSYEEKYRMIAHSLEALRKSDAHHLDRYVRINIPQCMLEYYKDGRVQATHRVIVGKAAGKKVKIQGRWMGENQTPTLSSTIQQIIFNPRWYVSDRIRLELNDELARDPYFFDRNGYVKMASFYPWGAPRVYQAPGPTNPLGRVKFEFPNPFAVYLHDTNKRGLFQRSRRDFSHSCMRLDGALDFARTLLNDDQNPAVDKIDMFLSGYQQKFVELRQPVPIIVEYLTAFPDASGKIFFCDDLYEWFKNPQ